MIRRSFILLDRVGLRTERRLWREGVDDWDAFLAASRVPGFTPSRKIHSERKLREAQRRLFSQDAEYFARRLPQSEMWRLYGFFREDAVFLDIETTGVSWDNDITVVGLFDGLETKTMVKGVNMDYKALKEELAKYKLIVTFNGATFDLPYIQKRYPGVLPNVPHVDLRTVTSRLGYSGGLKNIERDFGIQRRQLVDGLHGGDAVTLWRMYKGSGDDHYLNLLVEYNEEDIINLKKIADRCCKELEGRMVGEIAAPPFIL